MASAVEIGGGRNEDSERRVVRACGTRLRMMLMRVYVIADMRTMKACSSALTTVNSLNSMSHIVAK